MQKTITWILFLFIQISLFAQEASDTIITLENDTIICKIIKTDSNYLYYSDSKSDVNLNSFIAIKRVKKFVIDGESFISNIENFEEVKSPIWLDKKLRFGINGGLSKRIAENPPGVDAILDEYYNDLKSGGHFGLDFTYYYNYKRGVGLKYSLYNSSTEPVDIWMALETGDTITGKMQENININYFGLSYAFKINQINNKSWFYGDAGLGLTTYHNQGILIDDFIMDSKTFGINLDLGYDFRLTEITRIGVQVSLYAGTITYADVTMNGQKERLELDASAYESLARIDFSLALRFVK
jgi:hypothetical protein